MTKNYSELTAPVDAIAFDCDGTLSHIEGIDELARMNGVGEQVTQLTAQAMGLSGLNPQVYKQRLDLVAPTAAQVKALADTYFLHKAPDLLPILATLQRLNKSIYVISAGLYPAVALFSEQLSIDKSHVFAVDLEFDQQGQYCSFDHESPLIYGHGKRTVIEQLKQRHERIVYVGDSFNDYETSDLVTRFVGYGGAFYREQIEQRCDYYINEPSMASLLSLCLTAHEEKATSRQF